MNNIIEQLAQTFAANVRAAMGDEDFAEMVEANHSEEYVDCCASHDYIDPNECMVEALATCGVDLSNEPEGLDTINSAWTRAREIWASP